MGARTDAARAQALASRSELAAELDRLEAAGRSAVDIPAKVRRAPAKTAAAAGGAAFLLAGGPLRLFRRARRAVLGPKADLPPSLLPKDVDKAVRKLGSDGEKVRGTLEREFAKYLDKHEDERKRRDPAAVTASLASSLLGPVVKRAGRQLAEQLLSPEGGGFEEALARVRGRRAASTDATAGRTPPAGTTAGRGSPAPTPRSADRPR
jgi:hypothetical protein